MAKTNAVLTAAVETYLTDLRRILGSGGATAELSTYLPLGNLLNAVGATLKPKITCVIHPADQGAGFPDLSLYSATQIQRGQPRTRQLPEHGAVEVKPPTDDAWVTADGPQVSRYWNRYQLVLVTNTRDFVLVGRDRTGQPTKLETYRLAASREEFHRRLEQPRAFARTAGAGLGEFLCRSLAHRAAITEPKDLAWLLASYARDALARVQETENRPASAAGAQLISLRAALEAALGVQFKGEKGQRFFHSTMVQTLFYGIFSAWVLWSRSTRPDEGPLYQDAYKPDRFSWREADWYLRAPVLRALFQQIATPNTLRPLGIIEVLDWTEAALERVDRPAFFDHFSEGTAIPYFYEPFLEAFDPDLRQKLGVWYTPTEVVRYMVARVDKALKEDLGIPDGLADDNVYILDPCCGTGAYLAEVLQKIASNLAGKGLGTLIGAKVKQAAMTRVFGFEIMPAPFAVAHLQVNLTMNALEAPFSGDERAGIHLTNALTGWNAHPVSLPLFPELEEERDLAERVKREEPILVILGNPPYDGYAGMAVDDERELSNAYRTTQHVPRPQGQGLNDLYVRFFRMAERRIAEKTGQGVVCFISNYSWLDGLSFPGMRERFMEAFDIVRIDNLNGDKYRTGKVAPDGSPDPSVFSTESNRTGIQVGTAVATLIRKADHAPAETVGFRELWGQAKREELLRTAGEDPAVLYEQITPHRSLGLPFAPIVVSRNWFRSPSLPDLFPMSFPGVKTSRDGFLVDIDLDRLRTRIHDYFDTGLSHEEIARRYPSVMKSTARFDARVVRDTLLSRGEPDESGFTRYTYRPFDNRWLYWESAHGLLDRPRHDYKPHVFGSNLWLTAAQQLRKDAAKSQACFTAHLGSSHLIERGATMFPAWLRAENGEDRPNLSATTQRYLNRLGLGIEDLFHHALAVLHDPVHSEANAGALRMEWPRIPLPGWPDGGDHNDAEILARSAALGRKLATLLDPETPMSGVTADGPRSELTAIAVPATSGQHGMTEADFALTAGWGHLDSRDAVIPGQGKTIKRAYARNEHAVLEDAVQVLGGTTLDVHLNDRAFWCNVPVEVWQYRLGGYQVLKKWLSYRAHGILGRPLGLDEIQYFSDMARRIAAILVLQRSISKTVSLVD